MNPFEQNLIASAAAHVQRALTGAEAGHNWWHVARVWKNAKLIAQSEPVDAVVVELAALLHDIADAKFHAGDEELGPQLAGRFMAEAGASTALTEHVVQIVRHVSFKGGNFSSAFRSAELGVVQDADRLDALGAIGVARAFHYGGFMNRELYDPAVPPNLRMTKEEYKSSTAPTLNHFYEKLLLLKDRMNTATGKRLAEQRHRFMESYLAQFYEEWEGRS